MTTVVTVCCHLPPRRSLYLCDWEDHYPQAPYGTPWTGGLAAWSWGPEHLVRRLGFFVHRPRWGAARFAAAPRLEVIRFGLTLILALASPFSVHLKLQPQPRPQHI